MLTWSSSCRCLLVVASSAAWVVACGSGGGGGGSGEVYAESQSEALSTPINIGFGGMAKETGDVWQFHAINDFFDHSLVPPAPRLCHLYVPWDIAFDTTNIAILTDQGNLHYWIEDERSVDYPFGTPPKANPCEEVLISFKGTKSENGREPTSVEEYGNAFRAFLVKYWDEWKKKDPTDNARAFAFTPWNEPNNPGSAGGDKGPKGGTALTPETAALFYLKAEKICSEAAYGCKVAAGDMASNGSWVDEFHTNCGDGKEDEAKPCSNASWLDNYKWYIAHHATDAEFGFASDFAPKYWAFHGWQEINDYTYSLVQHPDQPARDVCNGKETDCTTELMVQALKNGRWSNNAELWDTEVGVGQGGKTRGDVPDKAQAEGAAFLLKISEAAGVSRIYYQGIEDGKPWELTCGGNTRPAWDVLTQRLTTFTGVAKEEVCKTSAAELADNAKPPPCPVGFHRLGGDIFDAGVSVDTHADGGVTLVYNEGPLECEPDTNPGLVGSGSGGGLVSN